MKDKILNALMVLGYVVFSIVVILLIVWQVNIIIDCEGTAVRGVIGYECIKG